MEPPSCDRVTTLNESGVDVCPDSVHAAFCAALSYHGFANSEACVLLSSDERILELNRRFRGVDEATDVLTFPSGESGHLGDVAISVPYAARQAEARGVTLDEELCFLAIHGALHLVGFDDETESERAGMVDEMNRIAEKIGLKPDREWSSLLHAEAR